MNDNNDINGERFEKVIGDYTTIIYYVKLILNSFIYFMLLLVNNKLLYIIIVFPYFYSPDKIYK